MARVPPPAAENATFARRQFDSSSFGYRHPILKVLMTMSSDGQMSSSWWLSDDAEMPAEGFLYHVAFEMDNRLMCWKRETDGCRQFAGDCEVRYCEPYQAECECMVVKVKQCEDHMDILTEADWDPDPQKTGSLYTKFWRALRVQYYDPSRWGSDDTDAGKGLETSLSCMKDKGCGCNSNKWFHWKYPKLGGNLYWAAGNESIGPSGRPGVRSLQSIVVRSYNDAGEASNMYFVQKGVELRRDDLH
ncbi:unnamed protein product [Effrenium voratum]|nr:unnamed protein product [Effrenium voratum]